jgi:hypothetical protein
MTRLKGLKKQNPVPRSETPRTTVGDIRARRRPHLNGKKCTTVETAPAIRDKSLASDVAAAVFGAVYLAISASAHKDCAKVYHG